MKIVVINRLGIGDIIVTTPILKALRDKYPDCHITFLVRPMFEELVKGMPFINDYILYEKGDSMWPVIKKLWRYNMAFCLDFKYRSAVLPTFANIPVRVGFKRKRGLFLSCSVQDDPLEDETYQPNVLARMIKQTTGIHLGENLTELYLPTPTVEQKANVDILLKGINNKIISIAPYSTMSEKDWPSEYYNQLIGILKKKYDCTVIILGLGSPNDKNKLQFENVHNLTGRTSLIEMSEVIRRSHLFIGGCSGPLHIAGATATSIIAIYTSTSPTQWAPRNNTTVLYNKMECSPCINKGVTCKNHDCRKTISVQEVENACAAILLKEY